MEDAKKELEKARNKLLRRKQITTVASVNHLTLDRTLKTTEEFRDEVFTYGEIFDDFMAEYTGQLANPDDFKVENNKIIDDVIKHIDVLEARAAEVKQSKFLCHFNRFYNNTFLCIIISNFNVST